MRSVYGKRCGLVLALGLACVLAVSVVASPSAAQPNGDGSAGPPGGSGVVGGAPSWTVKLLTGDVVRLTGKPGEQSAEVVTDADPKGDVSFAVIGRELYAIPGVAARLLAENRLDQQLFNLSLLARDGYAAEKPLPVLVTYTSDAAASKAAEGGGLTGATVKRRLPSVRGLAARVAPDKGPAFLAAVTRPAPPTRNGGAAVRSLAPRGDVAKVWLDGKAKVSLDVTRRMIGTDPAWAAGYDGAGATVAVLDTGIDETHPDLAGKVVERQNFVEGEDTGDGYGHGTHVASIIAGTGAASEGRLAGVAPKAKLINGKVCNRDGECYHSSIIAGMEWAATRAPVINMSLGGGFTDGTDPLSSALNDISRRTGALFVVSAGNENANASEPQPVTVTSPASADLALAVAAVGPGPQGQGSSMAWFTSIGPRMGDQAIKPEISAPGVEVKAARAANTTMGSPVPGYNDRYTSASGTSMAAPAVAGAAAILRGQHPDWTAQQLRDALTSTTRAIGSGDVRYPVHWRGAGLLDVSRAATQPVHATGILNLGSARYPQQPGTSLSGTVDYTNTGPAPITLRLALEDLRQAPKDFEGTADTPWTPPAGAVSVPETVTVPAGGSVTAQVRVDVSKAPYGTVFGVLRATADGGVEVGTTLGFTREPDMKQLTMRAIDRSGEPVTTTLWSYGWLMDLDTGQARFVAFDQGDAIVAGKGRNPRLPTGTRYAFQAWLGGFSPAPAFRLDSWTAVAEPEIVLDRDRSYVFDARRAGLVEVRPERPVVWESGLSGAHWMERAMPGPSAAFMATQPGGASGGFARMTAREIYTLGGGAATTGTFRFSHLSRQVAPPITVTAPGLDKPIQAAYPADPQACWQGFQCARTFPAHTRKMLVDAGTGSEREIADAKVAGRLALVRPPADGFSIFPGDGASLSLDPLVRRLADAGAAGLVLAPPLDGASFYTEDVKVAQSLPVAVLSFADGQRLAPLVSGPGRPVEVTGIYPTPYSYELVSFQQGKLSNGAVYRPRDRDLARQDVRYHSEQPHVDAYASAVSYAVPSLAEGHAGPFMLSNGPVPAGTERIQFYTPGIPVDMMSRSLSRSGVSDQTATEMGRNLLLSAGRRTVDVGSGPWATAPAVWSMAADLHPAVSPLTAADGTALTELTRQRDLFTVDSTLVCEPPACTRDGGTYRVVDGTYRLSANTTQKRFPLSTTTHTEWTIKVDVDEGCWQPTWPPTEPPPGARRCEPLPQPAVTAGWSVGTGLDNVIPAHGPYQVSITPGYLAGYTKRNGAFTVRLWVTHDDGATWTAVPGPVTAERDQPAVFTLNRTLAQTNDFVGYRVSAVDRAGNAIDQTVLRAARTRPAPGCEALPVSHTGSLSGSGAAAVHPEAGFAVEGGEVRACLDAPAGADFDLELQESTGRPDNPWQTIASAQSIGPDEELVYPQGHLLGTFRWRVVSYSGGGSYTLRTT
jgi:subtilisin family serine protease